MTKSILFPVLFAFLSLLAACTNPTIDPQPTESAKARQVRQWLQAYPKWVVDEAAENGAVYFKRSVHKVGERDMQVEYLRFFGTNQFELKLADDPKAETLYYRVDEATNEFVVSATADFAKPLNWRTSLQGVAEKQFQFVVMENSSDKTVLTMVPQP